MAPATLEAMQLTLDVEPHPAAAERADGGMLIGSLAIGGTLPVGRDLNPGDRLRVVVSGVDDGELVVSSEVEVGAIGFKPIKDEGLVVGTERVHKAKAE